MEGTAVVAPVLARLGRLNATAVFLGTAALVVGALLIGGWFGALVLFGLGAGLTAVLVRLWPALDARGRATRIVLLAGVAALAAAQLGR